MDEIRRQVATGTTSAPTLRAWIFALKCVVATHFALVVLSNLPANAISLQLRPLLIAYIRPLFAQTWTLFAPDPPDRDIYVVARYRIVDPHSSEERITPFLDLSDAFERPATESPLSGFDMVKATLFGAAVALENDPISHEHYWTSAQRALLADVEREPEPLVVLQRCAMAFARTQADLRNAVSVEIGLARYDFPRFTDFAKDDDPRAARDTVYFPWIPIADVAPMYAR
jgi:hypothetical protein